MTVYVDQFPAKGWGKWNSGGHMMTTDIDELHDLARRCGLRRSWFQDKRIPHYDLTASKRSIAVSLGAVEIETFDIPDDTLVRVDGKYVKHGDRIRR